MRKRAAAVMLIGLVASGACLGPVEDEAAPARSSGTPSPAPQHSVAAQWTEFVRTAELERLPPRTWPSTAENAALTAAIMCHNPASHGATEVELYHGRRDWAMVRQGDILFAKAFCPEAEAALTRALSRRPGSGPDTTAPAAHFAPARR